MPATDPSEPADEDSLYEVAPEQFVASRDALAKRMRSEGDKSGAARVAKLRRPPLTVWALNQVARTSPALIAALVGAGSALRAAMEQALGGDASGLRHARDDERSAVDAIVGDAVSRLTVAGYTATDAVRQRMATTLRAAIVDEEVADQLGSGVLDQDRDAPGFGMDALSAPLTSVPPARQAAAGPKQQAAPAGGAYETRPADRAALAQRYEEAKQRAQRLSAEADEMVSNADRLAAESQRLAAEAKQAAERASEARGRADSAVEAAAAARAEAGRAADPLASAIAEDEPVIG